MTSKRVVLTGAHSYLGQKLLALLADKGDFEFTAFITPWASEEGLVFGSRVRYLKADLTKPLDAEVANAVNGADHLLHFAWVRAGKEDEVMATNLAMTGNLQPHLAKPDALVFISSVAASPETLSRYGRTKFKIANRLRDGGAIILVTGLIVDKEPMGPYALLVKVVRTLPLSVRFTKNSVKVYPIRTDDFMRAIETVLTGNVGAGSYRVYPANPADINDFLRQLEKKYVRKRLKFPVSYSLSMSTLKALHRMGLLPASLGEKLLTFLYKDDEYLATHSTLPGTESIDRPLDEMI